MNTHPLHWATIEARAAAARRARLWRTTARILRFPAIIVLLFCASYSLTVILGGAFISTLIWLWKIMEP